MLVRALVRLLSVAAAFSVAAAVIPGFEVHGGLFAHLWLALLFGVVSAVLGPVLRLVSIPITVATLGLFTLVINGLLLAVVAGLSDQLDVGAFLWTIAAAFLISLCATVFDTVASWVLRR